jgi:ornithine cyclodeaminase/alanine dehydrogenase-like protein (mu-crystallin family)
MEEVFLSAKADCFKTQLKTGLNLGQDKVLGTMLASERNGHYSMAKVVGIFPSTKKLGSHKGMIILFDHQLRAPVAVFDAGSITALRTAATSCLASRLLKKNIKKMIVFGAGEQAEFHCLGFLKTFKLNQITIINRSLKNALKLKSKLEETSKISINVLTLNELKKINKTDVICLATSSPEPLLGIEHFKDFNVHINTIGSCTSRQKELDPKLLEFADIYVDDKKAAHVEAGNLSDFNKSFTKSLGDIILESPASKNGLSIFNSTGIAYQDLICVKYLYEKAKDKINVSREHQIPTHSLL